MSSGEQHLASTARRVAAAFEIEGRLEDVGRLGSGHIHDTFELRYASRGEVRRYVVQRINARVFRSPLDVMHNITVVTGHLRAQLEAEHVADVARRCLRLVPARTGADCVVDTTGDTWRVYPFVEGSIALDGPPTEAQASQAAWAFGDFVARLADLSPDRLRETIAGFHDLGGRMGALELAAERNTVGLNPRSIESERRHAQERYQQLQSALSAIGPLPRRVVHNDCKLNNVLLDADTGAALCVIDLDTVMEGTLLADFGDLVRTAATPAAEDERDLTRVTLDLERFDALARGYIAGLGSALASTEQQALPLAGPTLALENAVRFLTDHLDGDVYFKAEREGHNLDRARCQLRLCDAMLTGLQETRASIDAAAASEDKVTAG
jgi:aminoglycoside phosphotransferase (APT) family kinase protein